VYVANGLDGTVTVLNLDTGVVRSTINLSRGRLMSMAHNVHVIAGTHRVVVTAPVMQGDGTPPEAQDELLELDTLADVVARRTPLGARMGAAHVVGHPINGDVYVTAYNANVVLRVDALEHRVSTLAALGDGRGPHGMALCGKQLVVANLDGHSASVVDVETGAVTEVALGGMAVQAACAPDGHAAYVTLFDLGQLVELDLARLDLRRINLIGTPRGPIQVTVSRDGRFAYVADQGVLLNHPPSRWLYQVDLVDMTVSQLTEVGLGAHGVALAPGDTMVLVTNTLDDTVSFVETGGMGTMMTVPVGDEPNGIAILDAF